MSLFLLRYKIKASDLIAENDLILFFTVLCPYPTPGSYNTQIRKQRYQEQAHPLSYM